MVRPDGVISRYFPGVDFRPAEIARALREARAGNIGQRVFDLLLVCCTAGLQPGIGRTAFLILQVACAVTVAVMAIGIGRMLRAERRAARAAAREEASA